MQHPTSSAKPTAVRTSLRLLALWVGVASIACSDETVPLAPDTPPAEAAAGAGGRSRIAFHGNIGGDFEIFAVPAVGGTAVRLTFLEGISFDPAFSPDGRFIAFASVGSGVPGIYAMRRNGRGLKLIAEFPDDEEEHVGSPAWSPDGTRIAFERTFRSNTDIYVMQADGTGVTRLTESAGVDRNPDWSPDGTRIAFDSNRPFEGHPDGSFGVYTMAADGSDERPFGSCLNNCFSPAWSPDGQQIAFQAGSDLLLQAVNGGATLLIATGLRELGGPTWSPDGTELAFVALEAGQPDIFAVRPDGAGRRRITSTPVEERRLTWGR